MTTLKKAKRHGGRRGWQRLFLCFRLCPNLSAKWLACSPRQVMCKVTADEMPHLSLQFRPSFLQGGHGHPSEPGALGSLGPGSRRALSHCPCRCQSTPMGGQVLTTARSPTAQETSEGEPTGKHTCLHTYTLECTHTFHGGKSQKD